MVISFKNSSSTQFLSAPDLGSAAGSSWSQHMIAQDLLGIRANGLREKTNFGVKIALS